MPLNGSKKNNQYIKQDSIVQAGNVKKEIISEVRRLQTYPQIYPPDKYRSDKDIRVRAFEKFSYRVFCFIADDSIRISRFRYVKQRPEIY